MKEQTSTTVSTARIILFGSEGGFSQPVLAQLLLHGLCVVAVVIADNNDQNNAFPIKVEPQVKPDGLADMAMKNNIMVLRTGYLNDDDFLNQLKAIKADVILSACFSLKIPPDIWKHMGIACWNLHPSLLPKYRGPVPLYWQLKNAELDTGLTLHEVSDRFDAGKIVASKSQALPANTDNKSLNEWVAEHGVNLFYKILPLYLRTSLKVTVQDESNASYFSYPV